MAKKAANKSKKQGKPVEKLTDDQDFKEAYPDSAKKMEKPPEPPPEPRSTDPRRKQR